MPCLRGCSERSWFVSGVEGQRFIDFGRPSALAPSPRVATANSPHDATEEYIMKVVEG